MAYFHIDRTRAYADGLGLSKPLRGKPQRVLANAIPDDNSFYSSMTHELVLGTGGVDDGEDADVIVHEYGHSLQDQAAPGSLQKREGATMGEGFGDYLAAMMSTLDHRRRAPSTPASSTGTGSPTRRRAPAGGSPTARTTSTRPSRSAARRSTASARSGRRPCSRCAPCSATDAQGRVGDGSGRARVELHADQEVELRRRGTRPAGRRPAPLRRRPHRRDRGRDDRARASARASGC